MIKNVAIINPVGFDRGGATTLCLQYAKLGLDAIFNIKNPLDSALITLHSNKQNVLTYKSTDELLSLVSKYDRLLFFNLWYGVNVPTDVLFDILTIATHFPKIELCYVHCFRKTDDLVKLLPVCMKNNFMFKHIFSLNPMAKTIDGWCDATIMDMNALSLPEYDAVPVESRKKIVFSSGRTEAFKNTTKYLQSIDNQFLADAEGFTFLHEGAGFNFHKTDAGVSCQPQLLSLFDLAPHKEIKAQYIFKHYGEEPTANKFNLYPAYNVDEIQDRWRFYYAGVCTILGTNSGYVQQDLIYNKKVIRNSRERTLTEKKAKNWNDSLEYADIEKMIFGVPVLFSRMYADIINFTDRRLIYDSFSDIPKLVKALQNEYDEIRLNQYDWLVNKVKNVNSQIIQQFTKEL